MGRKLFYTPNISLSPYNLYYRYPVKLQMIATIYNGADLTNAKKVMTTNKGRLSLTQKHPNSYVSKSWDGDFYVYRI